MCFTESELLECSVVSVLANAHALAVARSCGLDALGRTLFTYADLMAAEPEVVRSVVVAPASLQGLRADDGRSRRGEHSFRHFVDLRPGRPTVGEVVEERIRKLRSA